MVEWPFFSLSLEMARVAYAQMKFTVAFESAQQAGMSYHGMGGVLDSISANDAWALYINTVNAPLHMQIFGRHNFDQNGQVVKFVKFESG